MARLKNELDAVGCDIDEAEFRDIVQEIKAVLFPTISDEEMICHTESHARHYIAAVRARCQCQNLPDWLINRTLLNIRKAQLNEEAA